MQFNSGENMTRILAKFIFSFIFVFLTTTLLLAQSRTGVKVVVIDAGHGGKDPGNLGTGRYKSTEKDVSLAVSLKLGNYIKEYLPDVKVVYTREGDTYPELHERAKLANKEKADLFISIHCNSAKDREVHGAETFAMGLHKSESNLAIAQKENSSILLEKDYEANYSGFNPNSPESYIELALRQNIYLEQSLLLASKIQDQFRDRVHRKDRKVKQAGFLVLANTTMPSILVELGFLTNTAEEDFLNSDEGQSLMASAIYRAFKEYKLDIEGLVSETATPAPTPIKTETTQSDASGIVFKVQFASSPKFVETKPENFKGLKNVEYYKYGEMYKYVVGQEKSIDDAFKVQKQVQQLGYKDAFIIALKEGKRIEIKQAVELLKQQ